MDDKIDGPEEISCLSVKVCTQAFSINNLLYIGDQEPS